MSSSVDERVVSLKFDNSKFEHNAQSSMKTLDGLKKATDMKIVSGSFDALASAVGRAGSGFNALQVAGVTAVQNLVNSAINAGKSVANALMIEPVTTGLQEYETKLNSIQTILANTSWAGTTEKDVNRALDDLNHYADKTIYNFTQMTQAIGQFTTAGVDLDRSTESVKGIANLAAYVGAPASDASRAMFQLSQALSTGTVRLQDWMSLEHTAGMGGKAFQDDLKMTARVMGTGVDEAIKKTGNFRESLREGWLTTEVLTESLSHFAGAAEGVTDAQYKAQLAQKGFNEEQIKQIVQMGKTAEENATVVKSWTQLKDTLKEAAQSGWTETWQTIFGTLEPAKKFWTEISNVVSGVLNNMSDARNAMLKDWADLGGRSDMIQSLRNVWNALLSVVKPIKEAFQDVFPPMTGKKLAGLTKQFEHFTKNLKLSEPQMQNLHDTFRGIFTVISSVGSAAGKVLGPVVKLVSKFANGILSLTGTIGRLIADSGSITEFFDKFGNVFSTFIDNLDKGLSGKSSLFVGFLDTLKAAMDESKGIIENIGNGIGAVVDKTFEGLQKLFNTDIIKRLVDGVFSVLSFTLSMNGFKMIAKQLKPQANDFMSIIGPLFKKFTDFTSKFVDTSITGLDTVTKCLQSMQSSIKANVLLKISVALALLAASLVALSSIDADSLGRALTGLTSTLAILVGAIASLDALNLMNFKMGGMNGLLLFVLSLRILVGALKSVGEMDIKSIAKGLAGLTGLMAILVTAMKLLNTTDTIQTSGGLFNFSRTVQKNNPIKGLIPFALSMVVLAKVLKSLGELSVDQIKKGLVAMGGIMAELVAAASVLELSGGGFNNKGILSLIPMAISMVIFAKAMEGFADISWDGIAKGLVSMGSIMASMLALISIMSALSNGVSSVQILAVSAALLIFSTAFSSFTESIAAFNDIKWDSVGKGAAAMGAMVAGLLAMLLGFKKLMDGFSGFTSIMDKLAFMAMLTGLADALDNLVKSFDTFTNSLKAYESINVGDLVKGLASFASMVGALVGMFVVFSHLDMDDDTMWKLGITLMFYSAAIFVMAQAMKGFSSVGIDGVVAGLTTLAGAMGGLALLAHSVTLADVGMMAALAATLAMLSASLLLMAPAMAMLSAIGFEGVAVGLTALGGAMLLFATVGPMLAGCAAGIMSFAASIAMMALSVSAAVALIGAGVAMFGAGLGAIAASLLVLSDAFKAFSKISGESIAQAVSNMQIMITGFIVGIGMASGAIIDAFTEVVQALARNFGPISEAAIDILRQMISNLATTIPEMINLGMELVLGLLDGLAQNADQLIAKGSELVVKFANGIAQSADSVIDAGIKLVLSLIKGLGDGLQNHQTDIGKSIESFVKGMTGALGTAVEGAMSGIGKGIGDALGNILSGAMSSLPNIGAKLSEFATQAQTFLTEMTGIDPSVAQGVKYLAEAIAILAAVNIATNIPIISFFTNGGSMSNLANGINEFASGISGIGTMITPVDIAGITMLASVIGALANAASDIPNTGGLVSVFTGENDLGAFIEQFASAAKSMAVLTPLLAMAPFDDNIVSKVQFMAKAISAMANAATDIPKSGGIMEYVSGGTAGIDAFAKDMAAASSSLVKITSAKGLESVTEQSIGKIKKMGQAVKAMADASKSVPKVGGIKGFITGNANGLDKFSKDMISVSKAIKKMVSAEGLGNVDTASVQKITKVGVAIGALGDAAKTIQAVNIGNTGNTTSALSKFANDLTKIAPKLTEFANKGAKINVKSIDKLKSAISSIKSLSSSAGDGDSLKTYANSLKAFGKAISSFGTSLSGFDPDEAKSKIEAIGGMAEGLSADKFKEFANAVKSSMKAAVSSVNKAQKSFKTAGTKLSKSLAEGIKKNGPVKAAAKSAATAGATAAGSTRSSWYNSGTACVQGLANGIRNSAWLARAAAEAAASQALAAAKAKFEQKSPSRAFYRIGVFNNLGLAKGFEAEKGKKAIRRAIVKTGNYAVKTLTKGPMKQIAKSISKSSALVNQTPKTFAQSFGKSFVKALHKLPKKTNKALHKLIDVKNFDKKHILKQGQALVKTYRTALNKASIATKAKYSPFNANALIRTKNGLEATATYLAASVKNGKISNALATTSKTLVKKINTLFKAGVKSGKWVKNSKSGMKQVTEQIIKDATEGYNNLQRILATLPKKYTKIMNHAASSVGKFIANNKSVTKYASGAISQFDKIYGDQLSASKKRNTKLIKQWDRDMGAYVEERDSLTRFINGNKGKKLKGQDKKNYDAAKKRLTYVNKQIADLNKVKGKINTLRKENKKYSSVKSIVQSFGEQLYANSTDGKQQIKAFEKAADNYEKARKKRNKQQQKLDNWDKKNGKRYNSLRKKDAKSLSDGEKKELKKLTDQRKKISKELDKLKKDTKNKLKALDTEAGKLGKGVEKALKTFRNEVKETVKAMGALSNVKLAEDLFTGFNWESQTEKFDVFSATVGKSLEKVSSTTTTVKQSIQAATEAFDVLSNAFDTGIDPFEKFTNTGTVDPEALFEYRKTQHEAYKDWRSMMDELKARGLHESMIELLEQQGMSAINRVRGFIAMSEDQLKEYNKFCQEEIDLQTDALSRSTDQQDEEYQKWMANVEKLQTDKGKFISADLLDKIRAAGVSSSKTVELMLNMTDDALSKFSAHYANAISDTYVNFASIEKAVGEASKKAGEEAGESTATGFLDSLRKANKENDAWEELLGDLKAAGFSKEVVDRFREMGSDAGTEWAKSLLEDVRKDNSSEAIKEIIRQVDELEAKLNGMSPDDTGYADIVNQIVSLEEQARESMNSVVREVNQAVADSIPNPFEAAIQNLEEENKSYEEYKKNSLAIEAEIGNAKTEQQKKLKKVYESLHELGFSEADGVKYLASATTEQVSRMYDDLEKREKNNKENRSNQLFEDYHKIKTAQNDYAKNLEWLSENVFTAVSNSGLTEEQREKAQKELLDQLRGMSIEDANAYIEALKYGMEHEGDEFGQWQKDFYQSNFSIPSSVADKVTAEAAAIYTGFTQVATQTVASGAASIEAALKKAASEIPGSEAAAQLNESGKTVGKKLVGATKNYVTAKAPGVGISVLEGIPKGLTDKVALDKLIKSCEGLGSTVIKSTKKTLKSNSPSKVFIEIGKDLNAGLAIGMRDNMSIPTEAATALAEEVTNYAAMAYSMISTLAQTEDLNITPNIAIDGIEAETSEIDAFMDSLSMLLALASGELDTNPVITPELDISLVRKQAQNVNSLFDNTQANIRALAAGMEVQSEPATMQFIQNNYSPKALDQLEIYRQTRNQFAAVKGLVYR